MIEHWTDKSTPYDGSPLESLWAYRTFRLQGESVIGFRGPCNVPPEKIVDLEDRLSGKTIAADDMVHWIAEHFDMDLEKGVWRQRMLITIVAEELAARGVSGVRRTGDDLFDGDRKLTISIAAPTPVSIKIHAAINVVQTGTPVPTKGLSDYGLDPADFGRAVLRRYAAECESVRLARCKVRGLP